jgi:hypothetical protein
LQLVQVVQAVPRKAAGEPMQAVEQTQLFQAVALQLVLQLVAAVVVMAIHQVLLADLVEVEVHLVQVEPELQVKEATEVLEQLTVQVIGLVVAVVVQEVMAQHHLQQKVDQVELELKLHGFQHRLDKL